jgi:hypothetical protein
MHQIYTTKLSRSRRLQQGLKEGIGLSRRFPFNTLEDSRSKGSSGSNGDQ